MTERERQLQGALTLQEKVNGRAVGLNGCRNIASGDGAISGLAVFAFVPDQDTVVSAMTGTDSKGNAVNFVTIFGISTKTLKAGVPYFAAYGHVITNITLTSGAIVVYHI